MKTPSKKIPNATWLAAVLVSLGLLALPAHAQTEAQGDGEPVSQEGQVVPEEEQLPTWDELVDEQERIVRSYVAASVAMSDAQAELSDALGLKKQAGKVRSQARALESATTVGKKELEVHTRISKKTNDMIRKVLKKNDELTDLQRYEFTRGIVSYVVAVEQTDNVIEEAKPFVESIEKKGKSTVEVWGGRLKKVRLGNLIPRGDKSKSDDKNNSNSGDLPQQDFKTMQKKLATGIYIGKKSPGLAVSHGRTIGQIAEYVERNEIALPPEATAALKNYSAPEKDKNIFGKINKAINPMAKGLPEGVAMAPSCGAPEGMYCMWIRTAPENARIVLPDIKPSYSPGMMLAPGEYRVRISATGFQTKTQTIDLSSSSRNVFVELQPEA